jgi:hypothetical protein
VRTQAVWRFRCKPGSCGAAPCLPSRSAALGQFGDEKRKPQEARSGLHDFIDPGVAVARWGTASKKLPVGDCRRRSRPAQREETFASVPKQ